MSAAEGEVLEPLRVPVTRTTVVATALATRDYQDVHHDPDLAQERGSPDIFLNILTTNGLVERFVRTWAGPAAVFRSLRIRLGVPAHPGDTLTFTGTVTSVTPQDGDGELAEVEVRGEGGSGPHVTGTVTVLLPAAGPTPRSPEAAQ